MSCHAMSYHVYSNTYQTDYLTNKQTNKQTNYIMATIETITTTINLNNKFKKKRKISNYCRKIVRIIYQNLLYLNNCSFHFILDWKRLSSDS